VVLTGTDRAECHATRNKDRYGTESPDRAVAELAAIVSAPTDSLAVRVDGAGVATTGGNLVELRV
jgi:hypothetical protein